MRNNLLQKIEGFAQRVPAAIAARVLGRQQLGIELEKIGLHQALNLDGIPDALKKIIGEVPETLSAGFDTIKEAVAHRPAQVFKIGTKAPTNTYC